MRVINWDVFGRYAIYLAASFAAGYLLCWAADTGLQKQAAALAVSPPIAEADFDR